MLQNHVMNCEGCSLGLNTLLKGMSTFIGVGREILSNISPLFGNKSIKCVATGLFV